MTSRLRESELACSQRERDRPRCRRVQQAGGARLPQRAARRLPRPADRGARPGRGPRRAADRARPGRRGGRRDREDLQGLPGRVRAAAADRHPARPSRAARRRCSPPGRSPWSTPTSCRPPACPGPRSCSPRPSTPPGSRPPSSPPPPRAPTSRGGPPAARQAPGRTAPPSRHGTAADGTGQNLVRSAYANLERLGLLSVDSTSAVRTVWLHPAVRAAVRAYLAPGNVEQVVTAAATALLEAWPEAGAADGGPQLSQALRDSAAALRAFAWRPALETGGAPGAAPVRRHHSPSPPCSRTPPSGTGRRSSATSGQLLGYGHAQSVLARDRLADAYASSGRFAEALPVFEATLSDREATFGPQHPETVTARLNVARSLHAAGRDPEAIALYEQVLGARERMMRARAQADARGTGPARRRVRGGRPARRQHPAVRAGARRRRAGTRPESPGHAVRPRQPGRRVPGRRPGARGDHRVPAGARRAGAHGRRGRPGHAGHAGQPGRRLPGRGEDQGGDRRVRARARRPGAALGTDHPDTIAARGSLGYAYRSAGRLKDAIPQYERVVADRERLLRRRPSRHARRAGHPRRRLPAGAAAARGDHDL